MKVTANNVPGNIDVVFTVPPPQISARTPLGGPVGTQFTVTGTGFQANQGDSVVSINGTPATVVSWSDTQIVATVASGNSSGAVQVTVNGIGSSTTFPFEVPNQAVASLEPPSGPASVGSTVTVHGTGLGSFYQEASGQAIAQVKFNGVPATGVYSWTDTAITIGVPPNATTGPVTVTRFGVTQGGPTFTVTGNADVTAVSPAVAREGTEVTISGSNFGASQSNSTVYFNGVPAYSVASWSNTEIRAVAPGMGYTGLVTVKVAGIQGAGIRFVYSQPITVTDSLGHTTQYTSAMIGGQWVNWQTQGSGCSSCTVRGTVQKSYDLNGNMLTITDELSRTRTYTYDGNGNVLTEAIPLNAGTTATTTYTYNSFSQALTMTDALGKTTTNTYDPKGNLLTVTTPAPDASTTASVTQFAYNTLGQLTTLTDPLNRITAITYTPAGLIETITNAQSKVTKYQYDVKGNRTAVIEDFGGLGITTTFEYDSGNRLKKINYPTSPATSTQFAYDTRGRRTSVTDANGKVTSYAYDDADRLISVTDAQTPSAGVTSYAYDNEDNLLSITDALGRVTSFTYDAFGRVTQTAFPSSLAETYIYDAVGRMTSKTDRKGQTIGYVYDALDRLTRKNLPDSAGVDYIYDLVGKIQQVNDPTGTYTFAYDNMGRLLGTSTQYSFLPGNTYANIYTYDKASNRTSFSDPQGQTTNYVYDNLNRLQTLQSPQGSFGFSYDALSRRTQMTRPNGVNTNYTYDSLSRLLSVLHQTGATTIDGATYTYDNAGNRLTKLNHLNAVTETYGYDNIYQLLSVLQGSTTTESYTYDKVGNRLSSLGGITYTVNNSNQLTSRTGTTYTYDNNGNTLTKVDGSGTTTYTWNSQNQLTQVGLPGGATVTFKYDPFGRRVQKVSPSGTINFLYDTDNVIEELDSIGSVSAKYTQGDEIDEPLGRLAVANIYYTADGVGSITSLTDSAGGLINTYTYQLFGGVVSTGTVANLFSFTGREFDSELGLYYYRARFYDSNNGKFLAEDPIGFSGGPNFYAYVFNNPANFVDPEGLKIVPSGGATLPEPEVMTILECIDRCNGNVNVIVISGRRSRRHNKAVGGRPRSYHLSGLAADIYVPGQTSEQTAMQAALCGATGISTYDTSHGGHTHVDSRPGSWSGHNGLTLHTRPWWRNPPNPFLPPWQRRPLPCQAAACRAQ